MAGFWQFDFAALSTNLNPMGQYAFWRAGDIGTTMTFFHDWQFSVDADIATQVRAVKAGLRNLNISYAGFKHWYLTIGQSGPMFGLENTGSTPGIEFLEMALPNNVFTTPYSLGARIIYMNSPFNLSASLILPKVQNWSDVQGRTPVGASGNIAFVPIHTDTRVFHTSVSAWVQGTDGSKTTSLGEQPEIYADPNDTRDFVNTDTISNVSYFTVVDGSVGGIYNSWSLQGEYLQDWVTRTAGSPNLAFSGFYVSTDYFLTGETRKYSFDDESYVGPGPIKVLHKYGAWQLALRYSDLNLNSQDVQGGLEQDITAGLNWYPQMHLKIQFNYIRAYGDPTYTAENESANVAIVRLQFTP
jgi:phosphate-selective porin OprO/OprP